MINYQLKSKQTDKLQPVYAYLTGYFEITNDRLKISLAKSIFPSEFGDEEKAFRFNRNKISRSKKSSVLIFKRVLEDFEVVVSKTDAYFIGLGIKPSKEVFKEKLLINLGRKEESINEIFLTEFIENYIDECRELVRKGQMKLAESSMRKYIQVNTHLKNYEEHIGKKLRVNDISYDVYSNFIEVINDIAIGKISLKNNHQKSKSKITNGLGYSKNTLNTITSRLRMMLKEARIRGFNLHPSLHLDDKRLVVGACKGAKDFYFNEDLLLRIYNHKPETEATQIAKDFIMLASTTGMRHQSVALIFDEQPKLLKSTSGDEFYAVMNSSNKTGIKLLSPVMKPALEVFQRIGKFPSFPCVTTLTRRIRKLFIEMKLDTEVTLIRQIYNVGEVKEERQIAEVASSHICRASFITNSLNLRVDRETVKMMTHKGLNDGSAFSIYDKRSEVDRAISFYEATKDLESEFFTYK